MRALACLAVLAACSTDAPTPSSPSSPSSSTSKGKLAYDAPEEWVSKESRTRESTVTVWTPKDNGAKESITVIRSVAHLRTPDTDASFLEKALIDAQQTLVDPRVSSVHEVKTSDGLVGVQLDVDFAPPTTKRTYHRFHAVFLDRDELVHVLYTSPNASASRASFNLVLNSLHHEEV